MNGTDVIDTTAVAVRGQAESGIAPCAPRGLELSQEQVDLIKRTVAKGTTDDEFALFLYTAKRFGLDPLARQIHAVKRYSSEDSKEIMAIQIGIDGFRLTADRTGKYVPGRETTYVHDADGNPVSATAFVKKLVNGEWHEIAETAYTAEYCGKKRDGTPTRMWQTLAHVMIAKCAEARALRRAFPAELSGVYEPSEMAQAGNPTDPPPATRTTPPPATNHSPAASGSIVKGIVTEVISKAGKSAKGPWTRYGIKVAGIFYTTFSDTHGAEAQRLKGREAVIEWKANGEYRDLVSIIGEADPAATPERSVEDEPDRERAEQGK